MTTQHEMTREEKIALQKALQREGFSPGPIDGLFGLRTRSAVRLAQEHYGLPIEDAITLPLLTELRIYSAPAPKLTLSTLIGLVGPILTVLKGRTMTTDQIGGVVRAILTFLAGLAVARGWVDNETIMTVVGALVTIVTALWSLHTNKPEKLAPK